MKSYARQMLLGAAIALITGAVNAKDACNTESECQKIIEKAKAKIQEFQNERLSQVGDFLRNEDKTIKGNINQYEAEDLCCMKNGYSEVACKSMSSKEKAMLNIRLPTARELVIEATKNGAEILVKNSSYEALDEKERERFYLENAVNPDGKKDSFFYSFENYMPSPEYIWSWSSSVHPNSNDIAFLFSGMHRRGYDIVRRDLRNVNFRARCTNNVRIKSEFQH